MSPARRFGAVERQRIVRVTRNSAILRHIREEFRRIFHETDHFSTFTIESCLVRPAEFLPVRIILGSPFRIRPASPVVGGPRKRGLNFEEEILAPNVDPVTSPSVDEEDVALNVDHSVTSPSPAEEEEEEEGAVGDVHDQVIDN
jgi:hypothetical protein